MFKSTVHTDSSLNISGHDNYVDTFITATVQQYIHSPNVFAKVYYYYDEWGAISKQHCHKHKKRVHAQSLCANPLLNKKDGAHG